MATPLPSGSMPNTAAYPTVPQRRILWTALTALAVVSLLGVAALVFMGFISFLSWSYPILLPIGLAVIIALVLEPVVSFVQRRGFSRETATLMACLLTVIGFFLFWAFLLPPLISEGGKFFRNMPTWINDGVDKLQSTLDPSPKAPELELRQPPATDTPAAEPTAQLAITQPATNQTLEYPLVQPESQTVDKSGHAEIQSWLKTNLPAIQAEVQKNIANLVYAALGPVGQAFGFLLGFGFVPIYVYYFLADEERISNRWHEYVPLRQSALRDEVVDVLAEINRSLVSYFRGQIIVAACNGVLTFIGLWAVRVPYSLVLGVITGALSIVPFLGIICSIIPALLLGFLSATTPTLQWLRPTMVLGVFAIVQMTESMFITPRVQSHSTGLHPLTIILGILFWSMLLPGLLGPIVAVPLTCAVVVLLRRYIWQQKRLANDQVPTDAVEVIPPVTS
jgi:predicted PurR-regulated permease PerM